MFDKNSTLRAIMIMMNKVHRERCVTQLNINQLRKKAGK